MPDIFVARKAKNKKKTGERSQQGLGPRYRLVADRLVKERRKRKINSFNIMPKEVRFETQEMKEKVILLLRQHWMTQIGWLITAGVGVFLPISLIWVPLLDFMPGNFQFMAIVIWYLLLIAFVYEKFITWFFHVFIITDERIIDVDFYNLLYKAVSEAKIDNIEDVTYRQGGVARAMFNFGDVEMQTAGEQKEFKIENVPQPNQVAKILNELRLEEEHEKIMGRVR